MSADSRIVKWFGTVEIKNIGFNKNVAPVPNLPQYISNIQMQRRIHDKTSGVKMVRGSEAKPTQKTSNK